MDLGKIGIWAMLEAMTIRETLDFAKTIEKHGYQALWIPEGPGRDPFAIRRICLAILRASRLLPELRISGRVMRWQWLRRRELLLRFPTDVSYWESE
jgi:alkanesulfonate monooxygenase SsuD/methylene tetrahydromethanopterin reductase-like flavin-dependent oxidoreductase (luciferase family)